jgi:hypothetical protein
VQQVNYVRGLLVERGYYAQQGEGDKVAMVDAELRRCGVDPVTGGALPEDRVERPGGGKAAATSPRVETRGKGTAGGGN